MKTTEKTNLFTHMRIYSTEVSAEDYFTTMSMIVEKQKLSTPMNLVPVGYSFEVKMLDIDLILDLNSRATHDSTIVRDRDFVISVYKECEARGVEWTNYITLTEFLNVWNNKHEVTSLDDLYTEELLNDHDG